jgi:hypothetical protein
LAAERYGARVLTQICQGVLQAYTADAALLVNYTELPQALWDRLLPHFGTACSDDDRAAMAEAARYDAKRPDRWFAGDTAARQQAVAATVRAAADEVRSCYDQLEALRLSA